MNTAVAERPTFGQFPTWPDPDVAPRCGVCVKATFASQAEKAHHLTSRHRAVVRVVDVNGVELYEWRVYAAENDDETA
jgi:hypothetical protein